MDGILILLHFLVIFEVLNNLAFCMSTTYREYNIFKNLTECL